MVNYAGRPSFSISEQASILGWRAVIIITRWLNRFKNAALPIVMPLKPFWWIPLAAVMLGFVFGFSAVLLLA